MVPVVQEGTGKTLMWISLKKNNQAYIKGKGEDWWMFHFMQLNFKETGCFNR